MTGKTKNVHEENAGHRAIYNHLIIGMHLERDILYERIEQRVDLMMEKGLLLEATNLWNSGIRDMQSVQAIGYKELHQYLQGNLSLEASINLIKKNTRNYAKRQMTYFLNKLDITWFDVEKGKENIIKGIFKIMQDFELLERK